MIDSIPDTPLLIFKIGPDPAPWRCYTTINPASHHLPVCRHFPGMVTYVYETVHRGGPITTSLQIQHSIEDTAPTKHTKTGEPVRRCIVVSPELFVHAATIRSSHPAKLSARDRPLSAFGK